MNVAERLIWLNAASSASGPSCPLSRELQLTDRRRLRVAQACKEDMALSGSALFSKLNEVDGRAAPSEMEVDTNRFDQTFRLRSL